MHRAPGGLETLDLAVSHSATAALVFHLLQHKGSAPGEPQISAGLFWSFRSQGGNGIITEDREKKNHGVTLRQARCQSRKSESSMRFVSVLGVLMRYTSVWFVWREVHLPPTELLLSSSFMFTEQRGWWVGFAKLYSPDTADDFSGLSKYEETMVKSTWVVFLFQIQAGNRCSVQNISSQALSHRTHMCFCVDACTCEFFSFYLLTGTLQAPVPYQWKTAHKCIYMFHAHLKA